MKKILSLALLTGMTLVFTGCAGEEEDLFATSAAERLSSAMVTYSNRLADAGGKWAMEYYPTNGLEAPQGLGYLMLLDFGKDNSVKVAMDNNFTNNVYKEDESIWEMIADNGPVLTFNTYNECMHAFSDPKDIPFTKDKETGLGAEGDYEFMVLNLGENATEGMLKGKKRGVYDRIVRLPADTDFPTYMADINSFRNTVFPSGAPNYTLLNIGENVFRIDTIFKGIPNIYPFGKDAIIYESFHPYLITKHDGKYYLRFRDVFDAVGGVEVQEFVYDEDAQQFNAVNHPEYTITGANPNYFFGEWIGENKVWQYSRNKAISASMDVLFAALISDLSALKYTFQNLQIAKSGESVSMDFTFRSGTKTGKASYIFTMEYNNGGVKLVYKEPKDASSANVLSKAPGMQALLDKFTGNYLVSASAVKFNLGSVRLTSVDNSEDWLELSATR